MCGCLGVGDEFCVLFGDVDWCGVVDICVGGD